MWRAVVNRLFGHDVFISYSSVDRAWAEAIERLLRLGRYRVYRDQSQLNTGEHLDRLLREVRRSTMLVVLVSANAMESEWVYREFNAHLERPRKQWRLAPVFLDSQYPRALPERFAALSDYLGVALPVEVGQATARSEDLRRQLTGHFRAVRKATLQGFATAALAIAVAAAIGWLGWTIDRNAKRDALLTQAVTAGARARFDVAELVLARAWLLDARPTTFASYRDARARRVLERPTSLEVMPDENVIGVDEANGAPYVVVHRDEGAALILIQEGRRIVLASSCPVAALVRTDGSIVVWACDRQLGAARIDAPGLRSLVLPAPPVQLRLAGNGLVVLLRDGAVAQTREFRVPELQPRGIRMISEAVAGGEMGLCPGEANSVWGFHIDRGRLVSRRWDPEGAQLRAEMFVIPDPSGIDRSIAAWISRVIPSPDCERFFVEYAVATLRERSNFEMVRLRLRSARRLDRFDSGIDELVPAPQDSGIEAIYATASKELRAFLLTSPVVLTTQVRTLASDVERFARWPTGDKDREVWSIVLGREHLTIFRNQELWSRYPLGVGEPRRVVPSADGRWVAVQGDQRTVLWRRGESWTGSVPPLPSAIEAETALPR